MSAVADAQGLLCYLETTGKRNVAVYERFGYKVVERLYFEIDDDDEDSGPCTECCIMIRPSAQ